MKPTLIFLLMLLFLPAMMLAQLPPSNLTADLDEQTGEVNLNWIPPSTQLQYFDDFDDGIADDFAFEDPAEWSVSNDGWLVGSHQSTSEDMWTCAYYEGEQFADGYTEVKLKRTAGTETYSLCLFIHCDSFYEENPTFNGYMFNIAPAGSDGSFFVAKIVDGDVEIISSWTSFDDMNGGLDAVNIVGVELVNQQFTLVINGVEAYSFDDATFTSGYLGVAFAENDGVTGQVEWDYVGHDAQLSVNASQPQVQPEAAANLFANFPVSESISDIAARAPMVWSAQKRPHKTMPVSFLNDGYRPTGVDEPTTDDFIEYRIYRDGDLIGSATQTGYTEYLPAYGQYEYTVTAYYQEGESDETPPAFVNWLNPNAVVLNEDFDDGLPASWSIEAMTTSLSWIHSADDPNQHDFFPTPYMLVDSDAAGSIPHICTRLISPEVNVNGSEASLLEFGFLFEEYLEEYVRVDWTNAPNSEWYEIYTFEYEVAFPELQQIDVTPFLYGEDSVWISWLYDDLGNWGWWAALDNVKLYVDGAGTVNFNAIPHNTEIPEDGGILVYDVDFNGELNQGHPNLRYWTTIEMPRCVELGPFGVYVFGVPAMFNIEVVGLTQQIPAVAPPGEYTFTAHVGSMSNETFQLSSSFTFNKLGDAADVAFDFDPNQWIAGGNWPETDLVAASESLPTEFEMAHAYPNPFNPTTTICVALPEAADLTVSVYNIMGQQAAVLADGPYQAGQHDLTFDASGLASGLYFIRATVPGKLNTTQKVMLVR